jgi:hypothetical protein
MPQIASRSKNFTIRVLRLALITAVLFYLLASISDWFGEHIHATILLTAGTMGFFDECVMRLLPARLNLRYPAVS